MCAYGVELKYKQDHSWGGAFLSDNVQSFDTSKTNNPLTRTSQKQSIYPSRLKRVVAVTVSWYLFVAEGSLCIVASIDSEELVIKMILVSFQYIKFVIISLEERASFCICN